MLFTIAEDLAKIEIQVDVDEADVGKVSEGQTATFTVDAFLVATGINVADDFFNINAARLQHQGNRVS